MAEVDRESILDAFADVLFEEYSPFKSRDWVLKVRRRRRRPRGGRTFGSLYLSACLATSRPGLLVIL
jgi:hypothetical protein